MNEQIDHVSIESDGYKTTIRDDEGRQLFFSSARLDIETGIVRAEIDIPAAQIRGIGIVPVIRHVCERCGLSHVCEEVSKRPA